jgi:ABC-type arginine transport system permease subunit
MRFTTGGGIKSYTTSTEMALSWAQIPITKYFIVIIISSIIINKIERKNNNK